MHHTHHVNGFDHSCFHRPKPNRILDGILWGGAIIGAGVLFLLEHLGYLGDFHAWSFWPAILVIVGLRALMRPYHRLFGVAMAAAGGLLLVHSLALLPLQWGVVWPVLIIGLGLLLIIRVVTRKKIAKAPPCVGDVPPGSVVMSSKVEKVDSQQYSGSEVSTVMGSYVLDLSRAEMEGDSATVVAKAVMGAIELTVPPHWKVVVESNPVMGGIENKAHEPAEPTKTLFVQAEVVLGGMEIRN